MADQKKAIIKLRYDTIDKYTAVGSHVPLLGEVCIVLPTAISPLARLINLRFKVGDGNTSFNDLPFVDEELQSILPGYMYNGSFYLDSDHTELVSEFDLHMLYIDLHHGIIYYYDEDNNELLDNKVNLPDATSTTPGITKLYGTLGQNEDGAITQKAVTDAISDIDIDYTIVKQPSPELDMASTYFLTKDGTTPVGAKINIPKDQFLKEALFFKDADLARLAGKTIPMGQEFPAIYFLFDLASGESEVWISVKELADVYLPGLAIGITNKIISVVVKADDKYLEIIDNKLSTKGIDEAIDELVAGTLAIEEVIEIGQDNQEQPTNLKVGGIFFKKINIGSDVNGI